MVWRIKQRSLLDAKILSRSVERKPPTLLVFTRREGTTAEGLSLPGNSHNSYRESRLVLHEENWLPLLRSLDTLTAVTNPIGS